MPQGLGTINVGGMLALPGFKPEQTKNVNNLPASAEQLIDNVLGTLNALVVQAIEARTAAEFCATLDKVFPQYYDAVLGLSYLVQVVVPKDVLEAMSNDSFSKIEAGFRDRGLVAFGSEVRDQAIFTAWTFRKISTLCQRINRIPLASDLKESNSDLFWQFLSHAMCTRFSLDCLSKSMLLQKPIYPDVLPIIMDGLRNAVNAYAYVRRALDLRDPVPKLPVETAEWDDEDQQLLDEANHDMLEMVS